RLEELARTAVLSARIFVAMWFNDEVAGLFENGIAPAITAAGYEPFVVNRAVASGERIDSRIMVEILRSRAVVADATGGRFSVYYEAGFAEGLGKPVIWTVRKDYLDPKKLAFDTRQFPHCPWTEPAQLAEELRWIIEQRLGPGPARKAQSGLV